jgi:hypothetical protein
LAQRDAVRACPSADHVDYAFAACAAGRSQAFVRSIRGSRKPEKKETGLSISVYDPVLKI